MTKKEKRELFLERLKAVQEEYQPEPQERRKPYNWKQEWGPIIEQDADWSGEYLFDLILYKLEKMYIHLDIYSNECRRTLNKSLKILRETIDLGKKTRKFDYYAGSDKFMEDHCAHVVYIYDNQGKKGVAAMRNEKLLAKVPQKKFDWDNENASEAEVEDFLGSRDADQWVLEHGYTKDQVHYAYGGEWDDPKNHDVWMNLAKEEHKQKQKDTDKFFKMISRNYNRWWW